jgi:hypothetical protein
MMLEIFLQVFEIELVLQEGTYNQKLVSGLTEEFPQMYCFSLWSKSQIKIKDTLKLLPPQHNTKDSE